MISVIIPVYNVEKYLSQCLESVINQTLSDIEIICVNDGSTDNSLKILNDYALNDSRLKVYSQKNMGQGFARNKALRIAKGEFICFVDPDDWMEPEALETCYNFAKEHNAKVIQFNYRSCNEISNNNIEYHLVKHFIDLYNYDLNKTPYFNYKDLNSFCEIDMHIFSRFYLKSFLIENNITFTEGKYAEDWLFSIGVLIKADKIFYLNKCFYNYRIRELSSCSSVSCNVMHIFKVFEEIKKLLQNNNLYNDLYEQFVQLKKQMIYWAYPFVPYYLKISFKHNCLQWISISDYRKIKNDIRIKSRKSFLKTIFAVYNQDYHKVCCILGIKIKFKNFKNRQMNITSSTNKYKGNKYRET